MLSNLNVLTFDLTSLSFILYLSLFTGVYIKFLLTLKDSHLIFIWILCFIEFRLSSVRFTLLYFTKQVTYRKSHLNRWITPRLLDRRLNQTLHGSDYLSSISIQTERLRSFPKLLYRVLDYPRWDVKMI